MRFYELMVIVDADLEIPEGQDAPSLAKAIEAIESEGGRIISKLDSEPWGLRRLAYEINHKREGFYVVLEIGTEANSLDAADHTLRLADRSEIVRHKIMRLPDDEAIRRGLLTENASAEK